MQSIDNYPLVSIISINYNQTKVTEEMLASLAQISYPNFEVILVDNASKESPRPQLEGRYDWLSIIESQENLGFAGGNNLGIRQAKGDYLFFLNNDTEVSPNFLEPLVETMQKYPEVGIAAPKIHFFFNPNTIQYAGSTPINPYRVASYAHGYGQLDKGQYNEGGYTHLAHGAAMLVKREVIQEVGLMAEQFFLYYEELDWCERIKRKGFKIYFVPQSLIRHKESMSVGKASALKTYYMTRNRILFIRRNEKGITKVLALCYLMLVAPTKHLLKYLFKRNLKMFRTYLRALSWHFFHFQHIRINPSLQDNKRYIFKSF